MALQPYLVENLWTPLVKEFYQHQFMETILMDKAHGMMLVKQGLLSKENYARIAAGLDEVAGTLKEEEIDGGVNDIYSNITNRLYEIVGANTGCLLHVGRSRNDMDCTCNRMQVRREILSLMKHINDLMETLLHLAEENVETIITYYTFSQPSQPGTFAHYLLAMFDHLRRDSIRLQAAYKTANHCPMGAAAGIGTSFQLNPEYVAELLGFDSVIQNSLDAVSAPDYLLETEAAISVMMTAVSRFAQDLYFWSTYESKVLETNSSISGSSTIMPQKKNPTSIAQIRAQSARAIGLLSETLALNHNTSMFPNYEASKDSIYVFDSYVKEVEKTFGIIKVVLENSKIRKELSYAYTADNFTGTSAMAEYMAKKHHIPFAMTHHIINGMIRRLMEQGTMECAYMTGALMYEISEKVLGRPLAMTDEEVRQMLDPMFCLNCMVTQGTPKPSAVKALIVQNKQVLAEQIEWLDGAGKKIKISYAKIQNGI